MKDKIWIGLGVLLYVIWPFAYLNEWSDKLAQEAGTPILIDFNVVDKSVGIVLWLMGPVVLLGLCAYYTARGRARRNELQEVRERTLRLYAEELAKLEPPEKGAYQ